MREIKFRAWDKVDKKVRKVMSLDFYNTRQWEVTLANDGDVYLRYFEQIELMQYTGLKDKNGKEIYEGDVLFHPLQGRRKVFYPYSENVASYGLRNIDNGFGSTLQDSHAVWEVIGNIYENPELLKE